MPTASLHPPGPTEQQLLERVEVRLLDPGNEEDRARYRELMERHHYLKGDVLVGEQLRYVAEVDGQWLALLGWSAAARHLKDREQWLGWSNTQRRRRLALLANNARFLILPGVDCPNLASRVLAANCARLSGDWQERYGHPILVVESFVDSQLFRGTCYKAQGWQLLGQTKGYERCRQDYYTEHGRPKQLWVRALDPRAPRWLRADSLPAALQPVEDAVVPRCEATTADLRDLRALCREVPEWRGRKGRDYPLPCLLALMVMATLAGVVRGQRDLAAFAAKLTQRQLRALGSYRRRDGSYDYPKETTFQRVLAHVDAEALEGVLLQWEDRMLGRGSREGDPLVAIDGKAQRGSTPHLEDERKAQLVSAQSLPGGRVLGSVAVEHKGNEIPAARQLLDKIGPLDGKLVMLDALHTCQETLRKIHQENGADYLLPVKGNHGVLESLAAASLPPPGPGPTGGKAAAAPPPTQPVQQPAGLPPLRARHGRSAPRSASAVRYRRQRGR
jgi:hypothetical protein